MDIEQRAKRSQGLLEHDWFKETMRDLREQQKEVFANSAADEIERREEAHGMICALNAIERHLQADVDALALLKRKGKYRGND